MSMLAEKRQRKAWVLNPRSTAWSEDSTKFGQRILEKMGWSPGKGLGANEQGMVDILRIKYKNDSKGLGCDKQVDDWILTQENFNTILGDLGVNEQDKKVGEKSLEQSSKAIKKRVHYHKFARGKDLSRYSAKDLQCILGMTVDNIVNPPTANGDEILDERNVTLDADQKTSCEFKKKNKKSKKKRKTMSESGTDANVNESGESTNVTKVKKRKNKND